MYLLTILFASLICMVVLFQVGLVFGAPWGHLTLGGRWRGVLPLPVRLIPVASGILLGLIARFMLGLGGVLPTWGPAWAIWLIAGYLGVAVVAHIVTPSSAERRLWLPIVTILFVLSSWIGVSSVLMP
jgi:hypothetical protein